MELFFETVTTRNGIFIIAHNIETNERVGGVSLWRSATYERYKHLCRGNYLLELIRIETYEEKYRRKGVATALLNEVIKRYGDYNIVLLCHPSNRCDEKYKNIQNLRKFYSKFGFISCGELLPTMIRKATITN